VGIRGLNDSKIYFTANMAKEVELEENLHIK